MTPAFPYRSMKQDEIKIPKRPNWRRISLFVGLSSFLVGGLTGILYREPKTVEKVVEKVVYPPNSCTDQVYDWRKETSCPPWQTLSVPMSGIILCSCPKK